MHAVVEGFGGKDSIGISDHASASFTFGIIISAPEPMTRGVPGQSLHFPFPSSSTPVLTIPIVAPVCMASFPPPLSRYSISANPDIHVTIT